MALFLDVEWKRHTWEQGFCSQDSAVGAKVAQCFCAVDFGSCTLLLRIRLSDYVIHTHLSLLLFR